MIDYVIVGGGVAGLAAAIRLGELGVKSIIIESGDYPQHKVCGEFFSPESLDILEKWNIQPIQINEVQFHADNSVFKMKLPKAAGSLSHIEFDPMLVKLATHATIYKNTKVVSLKKENGLHVLELSTGVTIKTPNLIIATGRTPSLINKPPKMIYKGIKAHFEYDTPIRTLEMFSFKGAYAGISPIEKSRFNVACLASIELYNSFDSPKEFIHHLMEQNRTFKTYLSEGKCLFEDWMTASVPAFGLKQTVPEENLYFIGDGAGTIPPATGNGLTLALKSGIMAAEYAVRGDHKGFKKAWHQAASGPIFWGKALNICLKKPTLAKQIMKFPTIANQLYKLTRA